jgi:hypothetical protein
MKQRKTQLAAAVGAALLVGGTAVQAQAPGSLTVQLYGQVGRAVMWADDGHRNKLFHVDAETAGTRPLGIRAMTDVRPGLRAGLNFQAETQSNSSDAVNFDAASNFPGLAERFAEVILEGAWGRLNIGQGEAGADNASTRDLSGTHNGTCACDWGGAIVWRDGAGAALAGAPTVGATHGNQDFEGRYDRFMYSTPRFGGFWGQVSTGQKGQEANEASLWFGGKVAGDLVAAIGWSKENTGTGLTDDNETIGGSISWLHTSGLNLTFGMTQAEGIATPDRKGKWWWTKVGYKFGAHAIAADYGQSEDQAAAGDEGKIYGVGYTWSPLRWFEVFALYQLFTLDRTGVSVEDISVASIGTVVKW